MLSGWNQIKHEKQGQNKKGYKPFIKTRTKEQTKDWKGLKKLDGVALLVADPPHANFTSHTGTEPLGDKGDTSTNLGRPN